jgi:putative ABC transport system substrate-binding protein
MQVRQLKRRELIALLSGAVAWPLAARAQPRERIRRIGFIIGLAADDPDAQSRITAFVQGLQQLGWTDGRNVRIEYRTGAAASGDRYRQYVDELIGLAPEVIVAGGAPAVTAVRRATRTLPIVFANVVDPVGLGFVANLARPGGNTTGFMSAEFSQSAKWIELLKQIAPRVMRVAVVRDPFNSAHIAQFGVIQTAAQSLGMESIPIDTRDEIDRDLAAFARGPNGGLTVTGGGTRQSLRHLIVGLAAQHRLPAIYPYRAFAAEGGLMSSGPDQAEPYRLAAGYVDRILKGEKPSDLPVQAPTKYETVLNLKTAKALGLQVPDVVRLRADEVIE